MLANRLACSSLKKTISHTPSIPYLPIVLCAALRLWGLSHICIDISIVIVFVYLIFRSCWWDFMVVTSDTPR